MVVMMADKNIFKIWRQSVPLKFIISRVNWRCCGKVNIEIAKFVVIATVLHMKFYSICILTLIFSLVGCKPQQNEDSGDRDSQPAASASVSTSSVEVVDGVTVVYFTGNDRMQFSLTEFSVTSGQPVRIIFENTGKMPKAAMGHNVVVLKEGVDANAYAVAASKVRETDFIPASEADSVIAHTKLLGPGEKDTIEFVAPAPGDYVYLCSFPAHCFAGMRGVMRVE